MFVQKVLDEYSRIWETASREEMHRFQCRLSQAMALGVMTGEEYEQIKEGMGKILLGGMRRDAARLATAYDRCKK